MIFEKKYIWISIAVSCSLLIASCSNDEPQTAGEAPLRKIELEAFQLDYLQATNKFADNLWSQLNQSEPKTVNFVFSPLSLQMNLSLLANAADGESQQELINVLLPDFGGEGTIEKLNELNHKLLQDLPSTDAKAKIKIASSVWVDRNIELKQSFGDRTQCYGSILFRFTPNTADALNDINKWFSKTTDGMMGEVFKVLPEGDVLFINALCFHHTWSRPFDSSKTKENWFYSESGNTSKVEMLNDAFTGKVFASEKAWMIRLPYGNGAFVMELYKPLENFDVSEAVSAGVGEPYDCRIILSMPKFKFTHEVDFRDVLKSMGVEKALDGFGRLTHLTDNIQKIDKIIQKTLIEVDEKGTKVETYSSINMPGDYIPPSTVDFNLNHPFGFIIRETSTGAVIAMGKICEL